MSAFRRDEDDGGRVIDVGQMGRSAMGRIGTIIAVIAVVVLLFWSVVTVPSGHVAVLTLFGEVTGQVLGEGIHLINPLAAAHEMSVRTQEFKETASVPSSEGLMMTLDTSLLLRLDAKRAADVYQKIGVNYITVVVEPMLRSAIRDITAKHSANALYTGGREEVQQKIQEMLFKELGDRGIFVENVLLRDVQLPAMLKTSIEQKQQAEQESLRMSFILQREKQEAERKRIEAQGIADFQRIVAAGISQQLLEWKGIEATEKLAASSNTKVVVIGSGKSGLPLILGGN
ncbi:MAG: prohibitin family protein [Acidobacteria bacterium]|nr:prohibitin family protein [Acidobacteriota bacterium]MCL5288762.1 prohibitin family protein [Acidobacteriota bacterium]